MNRTLSLDDLASEALDVLERPPPERVVVDGEGVANGVAQLVLTLVRLVHELMERQALRRIEGGGLDEHQIERLGLALMKQSEELERLRDAFGLDDDDLTLDLGPLGRLV